MNKKVYKGEMRMYLYHYFDKRSGPFRSLTAVSDEEARKTLEKIKAQRPNAFCSQRDADYLEKRRKCEAVVREAFMAKGGKVELSSPYYMVVEHSPWLGTWYEQTDLIKIPAEEFDLSTVSFTYGDSMPTFSPRVNDGKEYRRQVYTYDEILKMIEKYGLPQDWNDDGSHGPERYIEAHVWSGKTIEKYMREYTREDRSL